MKTLISPLFHYSSLLFYPSRKYKSFLMMYLSLFSLNAFALGGAYKTTFLGWNEDGTSVLLRNYYFGPEYNDADSYEVFDFKVMKSVIILLEGQEEGSHAIFSKNEDVKKYKNICVDSYQKGDEELKKYKFDFKFENSKCGTKELKVKINYKEGLYLLMNKTIESKLESVKIEKITAGYSKNRINYLIEAMPGNFKAISYENNFDEQELRIKIKTLH